MNSPSATADSEVLLARFMLEWEESDDPNAVLRDYQARYPHLAGKFGELALASQRLADATDDSELPAKLGDFRLIRQIAHSGMGRVFEAEEEHLRRRVAVKIIQPHLCLPEFRARFVREQRVLARLHQTDIIPIFAAGESGKLQYFVMPLIEGATLHHVLAVAQQSTLWPNGKTPNLSTLARLCGVERVQVPPTVSPSQNRAAPAATPPPTATPAAGLIVSREYVASVAVVMADAAEALQHVHAKGIVHRDIKPSNIMISRDDRREKCWLIDFGLAGFLSEPAKHGLCPQGIDAGQDDVAVSGVLGTPPYMAPEQWTDATQVDARTDVWGLGATLYQMLSFRPPFVKSTNDELRAQVQSAPPPQLREHVHGVPDDLEAICFKALQKRPEQRYQTASEFAKDLRRWLRGEPVSVSRRRRLRQAGWVVRQNKGFAASIAIAVLGLAVLALGWGLYQQSQANAAATKAEKVSTNAAQRNSLLFQAQAYRFGIRMSGWSRAAWRRLGDAAGFTRDEFLEQEAAAVLAGLDAHERKKLTQRASSVAVDLNGKRLLIGGVDGQSARLTYLDEDQVTESQLNGAGPVAFGEDGRPLQFVFHPTKAGTLVLWDIAHQETVREFEFPYDESTTLALTPDGAFVGAANTVPNEIDEDQHNNIVLVWATKTGKIVKKIHQPVSALALSPDGTIVAGGTQDGQILAWSLQDDKLMLSLGSQAAGVTSLAFGRDPLRRNRQPDRTQSWLLAAGYMGGNVTIWDLRSNLPRALCHGSAYDVHALAFSPDGTMLATGGRNLSRLWDVVSGRQLLMLEIGDFTTGLAFSPDGKMLVGSSDNPFDPARSAVVAFDLDYGRGLHTLRGLVGPINQVRFCPNDRLLAALSSNWQVAIWDLERRQLLHVLEVPKGITADNAAFCFNAQGTQFAFACWKQAKLWDVASGQELDSWELDPGMVDRLAFLPDSKLLLFRVETEDRKPPLSNFKWEEHHRVCRSLILSRGQPKEIIQTIREFSKRVFGAAMPADGSYVVVGGMGGPDGNHHILKVYEPVKGRELGTLPAYRSQSATFALDPPGKILGFWSPENNETTLMEMPSQKRFGPPLKEPAACLSPGAELWFRSGEDVSSLVRRSDGRRLLSFAADTIALPGPFNASGTLWTWGQYDGGVTVCDLTEVQHRLAMIGLGW